MGDTFQPANHEKKPGRNEENNSSLPAGNQPAIHHNDPVVSKQEETVPARPELRPEPTATSVPKNTHWFAMGLRILAVVAVLLILAGIIQYTLIDTESLYRAQYEPFVIEIDRDPATISRLDEPYKNNDHKSLLLEFTVIDPPRGAEHFLVGQTYLSRNRADSAITAFNAQLAANLQATEKPYQHEGEYYLGLAYLKAGKVDSALTLFEKIYRNKSHKYNPRISTWYISKVRWLKKD